MIRVSGAQDILCQATCFSVSIGRDDTPVAYFDTLEEARQYAKEREARAIANARFRVSVGYADTMGDAPTYTIRPEHNPGIDDVLIVNDEGIIEGVIEGRRF